MLFRSGNLLSSNTLAGLTQFGQQIGAQYQNQAFNQNLAQQQLASGLLTQAAGIGAGATGKSAEAIANAQLAAAGARSGATAGYAQIANNLLGAVSGVGKVAGATSTGGTGGTTGYTMDGTSVGTPTYLNTTAETGGVPYAPSVDPNLGYSPGGAPYSPQVQPPTGTMPGEIPAYTPPTGGEFTTGMDVPAYGEGYAGAAEAGLEIGRAHV